MGGRMPTTMDIYNPRLSTKVTIDIPEAEDAENGGPYSQFKRENVINLCMETLRKVPDWKFLMEKEIKEGKSLQLAWRVDANLDWIWLEKDVFGGTRDWAVLCGLVFKQVRNLPTDSFWLTVCDGVGLEAAYIGDSHCPTYTNTHTFEKWKTPPRTTCDRGLFGSYQIKFSDKASVVSDNSQWQSLHFKYSHGFPAYAARPRSNDEPVIRPPRSSAWRDSTRHKSNHDCNRNV